MLAHLGGAQLNHHLLAEAQTIYKLVMLLLFLFLNDYIFPFFDLSLLIFKSFCR